MRLIKIVAVAALVYFIFPGFVHTVLGGIMSLVSAFLAVVVPVLVLPMMFPAGRVMMIRAGRRLARKMIRSGTRAVVRAAKSK